MIVLAGCAVWPLGEDPKGKEYRVQANLLVEAIVQFKDRNGVFPASLTELSPGYIQKLPEVTKHAFFSADKETLIYSYSPSWPQTGQTSCATVVGSGKWGCHGYL